MSSAAGVARAIGLSAITAVLALAALGEVRGEAAPRGIAVANHGSDGPGCGATSAPCRSLGYAIGLASPGDTITVGPGEYREASTVPCGAIYGEATVCIDSALRVISTDGAAATVVRGIGDSVIGIAAAGVVFGTPGHGFTVIGDGDNTGVRAEADRVRIEGNVLTGCFFGMELRGGDHYVARNLALGNENSGFLIAGSGQVRSNTASGSRGEGGFYLSAGPSAPQLVSGNVAVENADCGFCVDTYLANEPVRLIRNAAIGNEVGIRVEGEGSNVEITRNNSYGNSTNCGLQAHFGAVFSAPGNFFGAAAGPGSDPADEVCNGLEGNASAPSPASRAFRVRGVGAIP